MPVVSLTLVLDTGTANDPTDRPGLTGLVADLLDEGAGTRNAIELSDALARIGSHLEIDTAPDATTLNLTTLTRFMPRALDLLADILTRPHLSEHDLERVRELRVNRLRQMRRMPGAAGDRALLAALFGSHPYGHGAFGTTRALEAIDRRRGTRVLVGRIRPAANDADRRRRRHPGVVSRGGAVVVRSLVGWQPGRRPWRRRGRRRLPAACSWSIGRVRRSPICGSAMSVRRAARRLTTRS